MYLHFLCLLIIVEKELLEKSPFKFQFLPCGKSNNEFIEVEFSSETVNNTSVSHNIFYLIEMNTKMFPIVPPRVYCLSNVI